MNTREVVRLIETQGLNDVASAISNPGYMLKRGWSLTNWVIRQVPGAVLLWTVDAEGLTTGEERILCVRAPETERETWTRQIEESGTDAPVHLLLLTEEGRPHSAEGAVEQ